jgi:hypothetical protein
MVNLFIFIVTCYGITNILIFGSIFKWFRNFLNNLGTGDYSLHKLFTCFMCLPFWVGIVLTYCFYYLDVISLTPFGSSNIQFVFVIAFLNGCFASGSVWVLHTLQEFLERIK